ncbi:MAG: hypothetical protein HYT12_01060 [Candidatus Liptonbacteria bacterium]|nr:hypothetical protein [Candidatus Liptonbacteria bacterium]
MGRFLVSSLFDKSIENVKKTLSDGVTVILEESNDIQLLFNETKFGKVLLQLLPNDRAVQVLISHDVEHPSDKTTHLIVFHDCKKVHHVRNDTTRMLSVVFENGTGQHLEVTAEGQIYLGEIFKWD